MEWEGFRYLRCGAEGPAVKTLQGRLKSTYFPNLVWDGIYGPDTLAAILDYQCSDHLPISPADGALNICTVNALLGKEQYNPVNHTVPLVPQPDSGTCWAASAAALTGKTIQEVVVSTPADLVYEGQLRNYSNTENWKLLEKFAASQDLQLSPPMSWTLRAFRDLIARGPIRIDMLDYADQYVERIGSSGHFVVIVGIREDGSPEGKGTALHIQDPLPVGQGSRHSVIFFDWIQEKPARTYNVFQVRDTS